MNMKNSKFIKITVLFLLCVCLFCSCGKNIDKINSETADISQSSSESRSSTQSSKSTEIISSSSASKAKENSVDNLEYIYVNERFFSTIDQNSSLRVTKFDALGDQYFEHPKFADKNYSEKVDKISNAIESCPPKTIIYAKDYYTPDSTGYDKLSDNDIILSSNINYNPLISKVTYKHYYSNECQVKPEWETRFKNDIKKRLLEKRTSIECKGDINDYSNFDVNTVPIIVTDVWSFSEDENEIEIVKAQNIFDDADYNGRIDGLASLPDEEYFLAYTLIGIFINGNRVENDEFNSLGNYCFVMQKLNSSLCLYGKAEDDLDEVYGKYCYHAFQKNKNGNIGLYNVSQPGIQSYDLLNVNATNSYMFADVNNDGKSEVVVLHLSLPTFFPPYIGAYNIQFCDNKFELVKTTDIYNLPIADIDWDEYEK